MSVPIGRNVYEFQCRARAYFAARQLRTATEAVRVFRTLCRSRVAEAKLAWIFLEFMCPTYSVNMQRDSLRLNINKMCLKQLLCALFFLGTLTDASAERLAAPGVRVQVSVADGRVDVFGEQGRKLSSPAEGLWSIATGWQDQWPTQWSHAKPQAVREFGDWSLVEGVIELPEGKWLLRDAYRSEAGRIKVVRRYHWTGTVPLPAVTLSVRWQLAGDSAKPLLPGILYHGNPSGRRNSPKAVPVYTGKVGEAAQFEEHRYTMPLVALEANTPEGLTGVALHSLPSPVAGARRPDLWWSLGVQSLSQRTELRLLSGAVSYNGRHGKVKALQEGSLDYPHAHMRVEPGMVIEKTFYLDVYALSTLGSGLERAVQASLDIHQPYSLSGLPSMKDIMVDKVRFAESRWLSGEGYAGYSMYDPERYRHQLVYGWAGQAEAPAFAWQVLPDGVRPPHWRARVQQVMNHACGSPLDSHGFKVKFDVSSKQWSQSDPVSEGQTLYSLALAIDEGRRSGQIDTQTCEHFLRRAADVYASRLLAGDWRPKSTAEAFLVAPLLESFKLFGDPRHRQAALKAADVYAKRHLSMEEPYWGGTLDASGEDKEGAWAAFQAFLAAYELTGEQKYLGWARHAGMVCLSYAVVWDIPMPAGRLADAGFRSRGWTGVSPQNQHLDVYGVLIAPSIYKLGALLNQPPLQDFAKVMFRSAGQLIDAFGSQGEQLQHTNFAQRGRMDDVNVMRGGYAEDWTVFWMTAHFLHAGAQFQKMGVSP